MRIGGVGSTTDAARGSLTGPHRAAAGFLRSVTRHGHPLQAATGAVWTASRLRTHPMPPTKLELDGALGGTAHGGLYIMETAAQVQQHFPQTLRPHGD